MTTASKTTKKARSGSTAPASLAKASPTGSGISAPTPVVTGTLAPVVVGNELRKKELIELIVTRAGMKRKDVKPVVDAMLAVLGDAFAEQREMNLPPLGKFKVQRAQEKSDGRALVVKLRQKTAALNANPRPAAPDANTTSDDT